MFNKCTHKWNEVGRTFNHPSLKSGGNVKGVSENTMLRLAYGMTNIELHCNECGDIKVVQEIGKVGG